MSPDAPISKFAEVNEARERTIEVLQTSYAEDVLDVEEFERRVEQAELAETLAALEKLVGDLPGAPGTELTTAPAETALVPVDAVPDRKVVLSVFGGASRKGAWLVPRKLRVYSVLGGADLDLREAQLAPGTTEMTLVAILGGIDVIVPPGLHVVVDGSAVLGAFEHEGDTPKPTDPEAPCVHISGVALLGGVEVKARYAGESSWQARRRRKKERKALRAKAKKELEGKTPRELGPKS